MKASRSNLDWNRPRTWKGAGLALAVAFVVCILTSDFFQLADQHGVMAALNEASIHGKDTSSYYQIQEYEWAINLRVLAAVAVAGIAYCLWRARGLEAEAAK